MVARKTKRERKGVSNDLVMLGGLYEDEHPTAVEATYLLRARNAVRKGRTTGTRPGLTQQDADYTSAISGTPGIQGIYEYSRARGTSRTLMAIADGAIYTNRTTTLNKATNSVVVSTGDNYLWNFATHADILYAAGGNAATDSVWYWTGTGDPDKFDLAAMGITAGARYIFQKWNLLFLTGFNGTAYNDNPAVFRYCDWGVDPRVAANWAIDNVAPGYLLGENFGPGSYGAEYSTGFGSFSQGSQNDYLLFLTNKRIAAFEPNPDLTSSTDALKLAFTVDAGCVSQNAFVNLGMDVGDCVYLSKDGVHSLAQSLEHGNVANQYLSWPIRKTFDSLNRNRLQYATGTYWPNEGLVLFLVTTGSASTHNLMLCMDIKDAVRITPDSVRWYKWDFTGIAPNYITVGRGTDDAPYVYVGDLAGRVMRFGRSTYNDMTAAIATDIITKNDDFGLPHKMKNLGDTFVGLQGNGSYQIGHHLLLDDGQRNGQTTLLRVPGGGALWGSFNWGAANWGSNEATVRHRISSVGSSQTVSHRFFHSSPDQPFWITSLSQEVFVSGPTQDSDANPVS